ncbi:DUF4129 domain-containing protein [Devriesea agamarum]|uniref:DUF4129 domain-containing protein n=1 Tax=Devriesea agamarum TaxID=472569 RepID=UPI00071C618F|nr:DUF4129 domain-containing protein [Devriesea agamarum]
MSASAPPLLRGSVSSPPRRIAPARWLIASAASAVVLTLVGLAVRTGRGPLGHRVPVDYSLTPPSLRRMPTFTTHPSLPSGSTAHEVTVIPHDAPWFTTLIIGTLWVAAVFGAIIVIWLVLWVVRTRRHTREVADDFAGDTGLLSVHEARASIERSRAALTSQPDPQLGIVAAWRHLEGLAAGSGVRRASHQTAGDYVVCVLGSLPVHADSLQEFADLYRTARFSPHTLNPAAQDRALALLTRLSADLGEPAEASTGTPTGALAATQAGPTNPSGPAAASQDETTAPPAETTESRP